MKAVFAGSFNPITIGHIEIVKKAREVFGEVVLAIADNGGVAAAVRKEIAEISLADMANVTVEVFNGLLTEFMQKANTKFLIRGLRNITDLLFEQNLAAVYKSQNADIEQVYFASPPEFMHVSSTMVRELARLGGNLDGYVAKSAKELINKNYR